jgi:REP element-mobilizing transposase RayT
MSIAPNLAYCFMPDHVHLLIAGGAEGSDMEAFARLTKQRSA